MSDPVEDSRLPVGQARAPDASMAGPDERATKDAAPEEPEAQRPGVATRVAFRDLILFQIKLLLDGLGDLVLSPLAFVAFALDLVSRDKSGRNFYSVLRMGERWDHWLRLYRPSKDAGKVDRGLLEAGLTDADSFLGKVEDLLVTKGGQPAARTAHGWWTARKRGREAPPENSGPAAPTKGGEGA